MKLYRLNKRGAGRTLAVVLSGQGQALPLLKLCVN